MNQIELIINLKNLSEFEVHTSELPQLKDGQVLLEIDKFSITSNNITYGVVGDMIGYWKFFPTKEGHGKLPCWGFSKVTQSKNPNVKVGERYYGFYPMASHLIVNPDKVSPFGFLDGVAHRQPLPVIYNYYTNSSNDAVYTVETEELQCLLRPLFTTSFLIDDQFGDNDFYNSGQIILTSSSSKTALSLAQLIKKRKTENTTTIKIIGLTSKKNVDFVKATGYYDEVVAYEDYKSISHEINSSIVDFAGNHKLQYDLQIYLGDKLQYNCLVGVVHKEDLRGEEKLPKKGDFFFAPTYAQKRQQDWGREGFEQRLKLAWDSIISDAKDWMAIETHSGAENLGKIYSSLLSGKFDPKIGYIIQPRV